MDTYPAMLNKLFGTRMKVIGGYKSGTDIYLAMERGEVDGRCGGQLTVIRATRPDWLTERKIHVPILIAEKRSALFPDTPTVLEFVRDEATRRQLELLMVSQTMDRPVLAPPGVPAERVKALRDALDAVMRDDAFRAEVERRNLQVDPVRRRGHDAHAATRVRRAAGGHRRRPRDHGRAITVAIDETPVTPCPRAGARTTTECGESTRCASARLAMPAWRRVAGGRCKPRIGAGAVSTKARPSASSSASASPAASANMPARSPSTTAATSPAIPMSSCRACPAPAG